MSIQSEDELTNAYTQLEQGNPVKAREILAELLEYKLDNQEVTFAVWCCSYWADFIQQLPELEPFERGEGLISHWKSFKSTLDRKTYKLDRTVFAVQKGVFSLALKNYIALSEEKNQMQKAEILRKTGLCYKKLGDYSKSLDCLRQANEFMPYSPAILAEMADCFALCGEEKQAKVLFREAFFIDAQRIDISFLDSELICCLIRTVQAKNITGSALLEWIPVYGKLYAVFTISRELRNQELGRLKQDIYAKENELKDPSSDEGILTPKLINMYFWLIDYYARTRDGSSKINDVLLKIKILDPEIHRLYTK